MKIGRIFMGMSCREFSEQASAIHEQPTGLFTRLRMAWHRFFCVYCRRLARQWTIIREALRREQPDVHMPGTMREKLRRKLGADD
ncbi:MAG: hypothetical protein OHK0011_08160 [Turneriella sp.]